MITKNLLVVCDVGETCLGAREHGVRRRPGDERWRPSGEEQGSDEALHGEPILQVDRLKQVTQDVVRHRQLTSSARPSLQRPEHGCGALAQPIAQVGKHTFKMETQILKLRIAFGRQSKATDDKR